MSVLGFTGYAGGLPKLIDDCKVPTSLFQKRGMKKGVLHVGGGRSAVHKQYTYTSFMHKIVTQAVNNGAIRLMYVIVECTQGFNGSKLPCAAVVGTDCDVLEWITNLSIKQPNIGIYGYHMDPYSLRDDAPAPRRVKAYITIDMVAEQKAEFADVWPGIQEAIDVINASLEVDVDAQGETMSDYNLSINVCYNKTVKVNGENRFIFHVVWNNHGFVSQDDQKRFFANCLPPGFAACVDRKSWANGRTLRMPYCGKYGIRQMVMTPITPEKVGEDWSYTENTDGHLNGGLFRRFNICTYEYDKDKIFYHSCSVQTQKNVSVTQIGGCGNAIAYNRLNDNIWTFFKPLMRSQIIPAIQLQRAQTRRRNAPDSEGGVPTTDIVTTTVKRCPSEAGVFTYTVKYDTFCEYGTPHKHTDRETTIKLDLVTGTYSPICDCTIQHNKYQLFGPSKISVEEYGKGESSPVLDLKKEGAVAMYLRYWTDDIIFNPAKHCEFFIYSDNIGMWVHDDNLLTSKRVKMMERYVAYRLAVFDACKVARVDKINDNETMTACGKQKALAKLDKERKYIQERLNPFPQTPDSFKRDVHTQFEVVIGYSTAELDIYPHLVPMQNGTCYNVLDGSTVTMEKHMHITSCMTAVMKRTFDEECRIVAAWFLEVSCGRPDLARYIKLVAALAFTMLKIDRKFYCNLGVEGRNGKSVFFSLLQARNTTR